MADQPFDPYLVVYADRKGIGAKLSEVGNGPYGKKPKDLGLKKDANILLMVNIPREEVDRFPHVIIDDQEYQLTKP